jgi:hypothetical protein
MPATDGYRNPRRAWHKARQGVRRQNRNWEQVGMIGTGRSRHRVVAATLLLLALAGCNRRERNAVPPVVTQAVEMPRHASTLAIPVTATIADLERLLNDKVPTSYTTTEAQAAACAAAGVARRIGCQFSGTIDRGPIRVTGVDANVLRLTIPVSGAIAAGELSRVVGAQPVSAAAEIDALVRLDIVGDWQPVADVSLSYRWTRAPGIDMLGRRISLAGAADPLLARVIAQLEAMVPESLQKLQPRSRLEAVWQQGFAVVPINTGMPPVWLRTTPQQLHFANYIIADGAITLALGATALTESFVGTRPAIAKPTPLPPPAPLPPNGLGAFRVHVPVMADYAGLESIVAAALKQVETPALQVRGIGSVSPEFGKVRIHATKDGRLAVGLELTATTQRQRLKPRGTVWLTMKPYNAPGTQRLEIRDVDITGIPDSASFRVLLAIARSRIVRDQIGRAMSQDFSAEYARALAQARAQLAERRQGNFILSATLDTLTIGSVVVTEQGLYLPVDAAGTATLRLAPAS